MKKSYIYFLVPLIGLIAFGALYWNFSEGYEAELAERERIIRVEKEEKLKAEAKNREKAIKDVEQAMSAPDFYTDHEKSKPVLARHQELMWEVGELLGQWEMLQSEADQYADLRIS